MKTQSVISNQRSVVGAEPPHPEIEHAANQIIDIYRRQRRYLASKETAFLHDLISAAADVAQHEQFSVRAGAEINRAAAQMTLDERGAR